MINLPVPRDLCHRDHSDLGLIDNTCDAHLFLTSSSFILITVFVSLLYEDHSLIELRSRLAVCGLFVTGSSVGFSIFPFKRLVDCNFENQIVTFTTKRV